ncbi:MAG: tRNA guanosine(34) transglycosylase Tgt [candidate division WOR-3 bacterium]
MEFRILATDADSRARLGCLILPHGEVRTPAFMPVGTQGTVKTMTPQSLIELGVEIIVCNTYHLYLRPGVDVVRSGGGLARFMAWDRPILTDSGGYQAYSMAALTSLTEDRLVFRSHLDGSQHVFTPELVLQIQEGLGSDIAMCLDVCPPYPVSVDDAANAVKITTKWARRSVNSKLSSTNLFAIVQGSTYSELRRQSCQELSELDLPGYAIGGLCLGEPSGLTYEVVEICTEQLPVLKPRYLMGAGYPEDIIAAVLRGVDMFDCVLPTRNGRTGTAFTSRGRISIRNQRYTKDYSPLDPECTCYSCRKFSRSYLRHLFIAGEALGPHLLTLHNLHFFVSLMAQIRKSLKNGDFARWAARSQAGLAGGEDASAGVP